MTEETLLSEKYWCRGLYGEVVTSDCYGITSIPFYPTIVFDLGANVGFFSRFCKRIFPNAKIISVEPLKENIEIFKSITNDDITLINKAIGKEYCQGFMEINSVDGSQGSFVTDVNGIVINTIREFERTDIEFIYFSTLCKMFLREGDISILKMDIECGENDVFFHNESMKYMLTMDYVSVEIHCCASDSKGVLNMRRDIFMVLDSFRETHYYEIRNDSFFAIKKKYGVLKH